MKKFLFTTLMSNDLGLLTRSLPIARELRDRGHQVVFCNPAESPAKLISDAGFDNLPVSRPRLKPSDLRSFSTPEIWNIDHAMYSWGMGDENFIRSTVDTLTELMNEHDPDAVVDFWNPSACIAARAVHKPLITVIQADMHPQSRGFIWWREPPADLPTPIAVINTILAEHQLKPINKAGELFIGDITLVVGMPETDPLPDTADVTYIGPILWQRSGEGLPDWIADLSTTKPVIWLYPGNPQYVPGIRMPSDSAVVLYACIEALKNMDVQVVLSTGHQPLPENALPLPSNFGHASFVPGLAMAERSDLLIHHGGYGSCQTGLFTGTPAVIIPTYSERESNARRVAAVGAGDFVLPTTDASGEKHVSAAQVRDKVNRVLSDSSFKENARRISKKLRSYGGAPYAARLIEESV
jgi:MGT family glycosyltransferase